MISELRVEIPEEVVEGESPVLFCKTTCNLSDKSDFTWYKTVSVIRMERLESAVAGVGQQ